MKGFTPNRDSSPYDIYCIKIGYEHIVWEVSAHAMIAELGIETLSSKVGIVHHIRYVYISKIM